MREIERGVSLMTSRVRPGRLGTGSSSSGLTLRLRLLGLVKFPPQTRDNNNFFPRSPSHVFAWQHRTAPHLARRGRQHAELAPISRRTTRSSLRMASWEPPFVRTSYAHNLVLPNIITRTETGRCVDGATKLPSASLASRTLVRTDGGGPITTGCGHGNRQGMQHVSTRSFCCLLFLVGVGV